MANDSSHSFIFFSFQLKAIFMKTIKHFNTNNKCVGCNYSGPQAAYTYHQQTVKRTHRAPRPPLFSQSNTFTF